MFNTTKRTTHIEKWLVRRETQSVKKAKRTRIAQDLANYGETALSSPSSSEDERSSMTKSGNQSVKSGVQRSLSDVVKHLTRHIKYDFVKNLDSEKCFSFERIVEFLVEWLNSNKLPFSRVREFFEEEVGKTFRADGSKAARLFVSAYWEKFAIRDSLLKEKFQGYVDG